MRKRFNLLFIGLLVAVFSAGALVPTDADARSSKRKHAAVKSSKASSKGPYAVSAKSALVMEMVSGNKLYAQEITRKILPASTTKVLTAILVLEKLNLDDYVTISARAANALPSKIYAKVGDRYRVRDLLYAALLNSANDVAVALAEAVSGSEEAFVKLMNQRAAQIGAHGTLFANPHGLPADDPQYSTAYDMALIFREAMKKEFFRQVIQERYHKIVSEQGQITLLRSHNKCLFKGWKHDVYGKTGYTQAAQACFVGYVEKDQKQYIVAVFRCSKRWDDIKFIVERYVGVDL
ncbi:MAG: D-alanyl-D-alanine carboxypeptidase [Candidatus Omnitrophica bacterium]|nr:D-alanyl-D-alanine carboxypeptidase [Candidatus Omnitrophota bacterium]